MPAHDEQIGERTGHAHPMSVLSEPAIAHLGEAEDPFDNPDGMLDPRFREGRLLIRTFDLVRFFARSTSSITMAIAAVDEVPRSRRMPADHCPLTAIRLIAPHAGFVPMQQIGQHGAVGELAGVATTAWIS